MPELPEVETVRRGLIALLALPWPIARITVRTPGLRQMVPANLQRRFGGRTLVAVERRAKYLLWRSERWCLINHLGMTGSWRLSEPDAPPDRHDHLWIDGADGRRLVYRDPRRFGLIDCVAEADLAEHPRLRQLGPEPLDETWNAGHLAAACAGRRCPIKALLLDQRVVAGIGNIYANEACFRAGIHPARAAGRIGATRLARLVSAIRDILTEAIAAGGSTISDFRQAGGEQGWFQHAFQVYGRAGLPCHRCGRPLSSRPIGGRATVWCSRCQRS